MPHHTLQGIARRIGLLVASAGLLAACSAPPSMRAPVEPANEPAAAAAAPCSGAFVAYDLDHVTNGSRATPRLFDSNGSGLAANDLDGDPDIVLANVSGSATILWNRAG